MILIIILHMIHGAKVIVSISLNTLHHGKERHDAIITNALFGNFDGTREIVVVDNLFSQTCAQGFCLRTWSFGEGRDVYDIGIAAGVVDVIDVGGWEIVNNCNDVDGSW